MNQTLMETSTLKNPAPEGLCPGSHAQPPGKGHLFYSNSALLNLITQSQGQSGVSHFINSHLSRDAEGSTHTQLDPEAINIFNWPLFTKICQPESSISCICLFEEKVILFSVATHPARKEKVFKQNKFHKIVLFL
jgi:hypothetical protein